MRKPLFLIAVNACLLIAIFAWLVQSLFVVQRVAQAQSVERQAFLQHGGKGRFMPLSMGAVVGMGDVIRTGTKGGAEFKWRGGTRWKLGPNSQLSIQSAVVNSAQNIETTQLQLAQGQFWLRAVTPLAASSRFVIQTPTATTQIHGTVLGVKATDSATEISVYKGQVEVRGGNSDASLSQGKMAFVTSSDLRVAPITDLGEFTRQPSLVSPALDVSVQELSKKEAVIFGETEAGDVVRINQKAVTVERTGLFKLSVPLKKGQNLWQIESTDQHDQKSVVSKNLNIAVSPHSCQKAAA